MRKWSYHKKKQYEIIKQAHERGHFGVKKTKEAICDDYFIPKLDEKVNDVVMNCIPCILINRKRGKQEGELNPLPKPEVPLHTNHMDFIGPLETTSKMYKQILVVVDSFTKFCWLYPTKTTSAACVIAKLTLQSVTFGNSSCIITDRGSAFTGEEFKQYCEQEGIHNIKVTTGLPCANGQVERLNAIVAKQLLSQRPVLGIYNENLETEMQTDASIDIYGAVLLQKSLEDGQFHPIYFMSRKTSDQERKYSNYELEILAVIEALKRFRVYLLGIDFTIVTDCDAFTKT